ncbi:hypothetical protein EYF80_043856 [Liparis tanakae]|uniref:Uncharacterized protein n=1 Tax=Liparis tanakae TaxID=230148 RepID=A0A4Z2FYP2_9TELE|nr:hypothetical protein EYF80_043856 [Liparis tanakae]
MLYDVIFLRDDERTRLTVDSNQSPSDTQVLIHTTFNVRDLVSQNIDEEERRRRSGGGEGEKRRRGRGRGGGGEEEEEAASHILTPASPHRILWLLVLPSWSTRGPYGTSRVSKALNPVLQVLILHSGPSGPDPSLRSFRS